MRSMLFTTAQDSFNIFRPNLDPEDDFVETNMPEEETKESEAIKPSEFAVESDEDME